MPNSRIALSLITDAQEFQLLQAEDGRKAARRAGCEIDAVFADGESVTQIRQLFSFIQAPEDERPAAVLVEPVSGQTLERVAQTAVKNGLGWVLLNANAGYLDVLRRENPKVPISAVMTDQIEIGRIQARQFRALLPDGGDMLYVKQGPFSNPAASERLKGMQEGIQGAGIRVRYVSSDWTEAGTEKAIGKWLKLNAAGNPDLDLVGCQNDSQAIGAQRAIKRYHVEWAHLPYTGCDGLPEGGQRLVRSGMLAATVVMPTSAGPAIDMVLQSLTSGRAAPAVKTLAPRSYPEISKLAS